VLYTQRDVQYAPLSLPFRSSSQDSVRIFPSVLKQSRPSHLPLLNILKIRRDASIYVTLFPLSLALSSLSRH
jgi:hypothetical protein